MKDELIITYDASSRGVPMLMVFREKTDDKRLVVINAFYGGEAEVLYDYLCDPECSSCKYDGREDCEEPCRTCVGFDGGECESKFELKENLDGKDNM